MYYLFASTFSSLIIHNNVHASIQIINKKRSSLHIYFANAIIAYIMLEIFMNSTIQCYKVSKSKITN